MQSFFRYLKTHKAFILFLFAFSWILTLKNKLDFATIIGEFTFHYDTPFWTFLNAFVIFTSIDFIKRKMKIGYSISHAGYLNYSKYFVIGFAFYLVYINLFAIIISLTFDTFSQNFGSTYQIFSGLLHQSIDFFLFGGFSLAYLYHRENINYQQRINDYDASLSKSKIQQLKAQLNPHFLFNNLNILDQLIEEDKELASDFLSQFSELYRYALSSSDKELIPIEEELIFAKNYFEMMEKKYQGYYQLHIDNNCNKSSFLLPPFCLQVLIENAIAHNLGTKETPVIIQVSFEDGIKVTNNKVSSLKKKIGNGLALKNLSKQFRLLTDRTISITDTKQSFTVVLPLINMYRHD